jgi:hypothetical protein
MIQGVPYIPKHWPADPEPWLWYGSTEEEYRFWIPHVCGVCCLKMAGDASGCTNDHSLHDLTKMLLSEGAFVVKADGEVDGIFHHPLAAVSRRLGLPAAVAGKLTVDELDQHLQAHQFVMLSVELSRCTKRFSGGHLILIHSYDPLKQTYVAHDPSSVVASTGRNVVLRKRALKIMSNNKGLILG